MCRIVTLGIANLSGDACSVFFLLPFHINVNIVTLGIANVSAGEW